ncbi:S-layer homology domain-containing protein [Chengkuizengella axinellae]|uniref:S-layer homology domain-containing protein n=1 Tax=Chengkuizengella axinellae TaxID=3064388 RepID=A0ABT9IUZ9_9BACL|nr:S-layer homology domain-containing protein [Chengkuizengella sp. 2205SS18-9]MDP5273184.1 S-layer homology domain-containing protein [Chengkuizengella sp. 2205SS18-9]
MKKIALIIVIIFSSFQFNLSVSEAITMSNVGIDIDGSRVVWQDLKLKLNVYDLEKKENKPFSDRKSRQFSPSLYGDKLVYVDDRNEGWDIYLYDFTSEEEIPLVVHDSHQSSPSLFENIVVWDDLRDGDLNIYMMEIEKGNEIQVTNNPETQHNPIIYGDKIVWQDNRNGNWDIYMYDLTSKQEIRVTSNKDDQINPKIYGDTIVWQDYRNENRDIYIYDILTKEETKISTDGSNDRNPDIYGSKIVWSGTKDKDSVFYIYDLNDDGDVQTITHTINYPVIYQDKVVWQDHGMIKNKTINYENHSPEIIEYIPSHYMNVGLNTIIDLTEVFYDKDGDFLTYQIESREEVVEFRTIEKTNLELTSTGLGKTEIIITASDKNGGTVKTEFKIQVINSDQNDSTFSDIQNHWAKNEIELLSSINIVNGITEDEFHPEGTLTRAQIAAMIVRALEIPENKSDISFSDVVDGWYVKDVITASAVGLVNGYEDGTFLPNKEITRQELVVMMNRVMEYIGKDVQKSNITEEETLLQPFTDQDAISEWSKDAILELLELDIAFGKTESNFAPKEDATRAEAVVMLSRLMQYMGLIQI